MEEGLWKELLEYGRLSPSPHNLQAWLFQIESDTEAVLLFDPRRLLPGTDPTGRFIAAGFGIMLEMLSIAAAPHGLKLEAAYTGQALDPSLTVPTPFARLRLVPRGQPEPLDRELIRQRRTSRLPYLNRPIPQEILNELSGVAREFGHELEFSTDPRQVGWVMNLNARTLFYDITDPVTRRELGGWIRYGMAEARRKADGLASYAMGFPAWVIWLFFNANLLFRLPVIYQVSYWLYRRSMRGTGTVAWISGPFGTAAEWDAAGRMLARLWLTMTKHELYLHPFGSVITNATAHEQMEKHFYNAERKHPLWLIVRLGYSETPPKAQRLPLERLVV